MRPRILEYSKQTAKAHLWSFILHGYKAVNLPMFNDPVTRHIMSIMIVADLLAMGIIYAEFPKQPMPTVIEDITWLTWTVLLQLAFVLTDYLPKDD